MTIAVGALDGRAGARDGGRSRGGGRAARRAVVRWAWRLFRREWRQQLFVLALLIVAVAATTAGVAMATGATSPAETTFTLSGSDAKLAADVAAIREAYGNVEVFAHQKIPVPGSVATVDLRAQDPLATPSGATGLTALRLVSGRYPSAAGEVAVTRGVAAAFDLRVGGTWTEGGQARRVVGLVENPRQLSEDFGVLAPGALETPSTVTVRIAGTPRDFSSLQFPGRRPLDIVGNGSSRAAATATVLALATICLLFIGLVAVAGFTVMAQRRQRALGMLGAVGASDRHVRMVMVANGAVLGAVAALVGAVTGVVGWIALAPRLESVADHRIDRFALPWWAIGAAAGLAILTAVAAAWWPARSASRLPVVAALSGRPPRPRPAQRSAAAGVLVLAGGLLALAFSNQRQNHPNPLLIIAGTVATTLGALLFAPLAVRALGAVAGRAPVAARLSLRNLARYQARTGAALGAIALVVGIAATIAVSARSADADAARAAGAGNLPANELVVHLTEDVGGPLTAVPADQMQTLQGRVTDIAASFHSTDVVELDGAAMSAAPSSAGNPGLTKGGNGHVAVSVGDAPPPAALGRVTPVENGFRMDHVIPLYVATPAVLAHYGINPADVDPTADVLSSEPGLAGFQVISGRQNIEHPKIQAVALPRYTSDPNSLITAQAVRTLGVQVLPAGWLIRSGHALTAAEVDAARRVAAAAGLTIETRSAPHSLTALGRYATGVAVLVVLGVLAMVIGLLRTETAGDLRTLTAAGAGRRTRRALTATTAGALALLGAVLGTAGAYLALVAWHRSDLGTLRSVPVVNLAVILVGLPVVAVAAAWLLAGREPAAISRRPLE